MKKILITGQSGMLGQSIVTRMSAVENTELYGVSKTQRLNSTAIQEFNVDLASNQQVKELLNSIRPDIIIHTAALTNLLYCENNKHETHQLHVTLTRTLAAAGVPLIYISTDSVFDGVDGMYSEESPVYPLNYYAMSKLQGEWAALCQNPDTLILRTNIIGFKKPGGNSLAEWAIRSFVENKTISGYSDVFFNPLYVGQLADLIVRCIQVSPRGVLHVGTSENISKFEFLKSLAETFGFSNSLVQESDAPPDQGLRRPKNTTLNTTLMKAVLGKQPSLKEALNMLKSDYLKTYETY